MKRWSNICVFLFGLFSIYPCFLKREVKGGCHRSCDLACYSLFYDTNGKITHFIWKDTLENGGRKWYATKFPAKCPCPVPFMEGKRLRTPITQRTAGSPACEPNLSGCHWSPSTSPLTAQMQAKKREQKGRENGRSGGEGCRGQLPSVYTQNPTLLPLGLAILFNCYCFLSKVTRVRHFPTK